MARAKFGAIKKEEPYKSYISPICQDTPLQRHFHFWHVSYIADVIAHAKFYVNCFGNFGVLTPQICLSL